MEKYKSIDWNQMSELTLIRRINTEILHPIGLAISRTKEGISEKVIIAPDGVFTYVIVSAILITPFYLLIMYFRKKLNLA